VNKHPSGQLLHTIKAQHHPWPEIAPRNIKANLTALNTKKHHRKDAETRRKKSLVISH
jgi:hypothetical protein